jgi:exopolysaccharide biosynthesis polyprenyl glycosylphosphotransferase
MSAVTEHAALVQGLELHDELTAVADDRTLEILDRRRRTAVVHRRGWLVRRMLLAADVVGLVSAFLLVEWFATQHGGLGSVDAHSEIVVFFASIPGWIVVAKLYGLYDKDEERTDHSTADDFLGVFHMVTVCTFSLWAVAYLTHMVHPTAARLVPFWAAAVCCISVGRASARFIARRNVAYIQNAVIVGAGDVGQFVAKKLLQHPEYGINLVGFVDSEPKERRGDLEHLALLGGFDRLGGIVRLFDVERVIIAFSNESHEELLELIRGLKTLDLQVDIVPRLFETLGPAVGFHLIEGIPLLGLPPLRLSASSALLKRAVDVVAAALLMLLLSPVLVGIAFAVKLDSAGPVLYRHERVGRRRRPIEILKFRTMYRESCRGVGYGGEAAEARFRELIADPERAAEFEESYKFAADPRVTRLGRILRRTSLDELPQLYNVLAGHISLVGPRAVTVDELERYGDRVEDLLGVRPGVTGYWQINGRSRLSYEDRVRLDLSYIRGWSLRLDLEILAKTARALVTARGAH